MILRYKFLSILFMKREKILPALFIVSISLSLSSTLYFIFTLDIHPDEAYYFSWSEFLSSGYIDHPPAIAYIIKLSRIIFDGNLRIRGLNLLLSFATLIFLYYSIKILNREYYGALIISALSPIFITGSVISTPDTPLIFFISAYIYFSLKNLIDSIRISVSIISGIMLGLALLSKYTAFSIYISLLVLYFLFKNRPHLRMHIVIIPLITSFVVYLPNLIYNINNGYQSYIFQLAHATSSPSFEPSKTFLPFLLSQIFIFSPFAMVIFISRLFKRDEDRKEIKHFLVIISVVPFLILIPLSLFKHIEPNWTALSFIPISILIAGELERQKAVFISSIIYQYAIFILISLQVIFSIIPLKPHIDPLSQIRYWKKTSDMIIQNLPQNKRVVTFRYQLSSILYYYSERRITSICLDRRFVKGEIGLMEAKDWVMIDFFPAKTAYEIALNVCHSQIKRIPLVISENLNIIRRVDIIYCE